MRSGPSRAGRKPGPDLPSAPETEASPPSGSDSRGRRRPAGPLHAPSGRRSRRRRPSRFRFRSRSRWARTISSADAASEQGRPGRRQGRHASLPGPPRGSRSGIRTGSGRRAGGCWRFAIACARSMGGRSTSRTGIRSPSSSARCSPRTPTTETATLHTTACVSGFRPGRRSATHRPSRWRRRSSPGA